jgi:hypothetical protein
MAGVRFPTGARYFSLYQIVQGGSGARSTSYSMNTGSSFHGVKRPGHEADQSPQPNAEVKHDGAISPLDHTSSRHGTYLSKCRDNFSSFIFN